MMQNQIQTCEKCVGWSSHYHKASGEPVMNTRNAILYELEKYPGNIENMLWHAALGNLRFKDDFPHR